MKEVVCGLILTAILSAGLVPVSAQKLKIFDLIPPRVQAKPSPVAKTKFETVEAYSSGSGAWVRWRMESETENFGFYIYRIDGKGRTRVSDEPTQGSARIYGRTFTDTEYKFFDKKGSPGAMYQVETLPLRSSPLTSNF